MLNYLKLQVLCFLAISSVATVAAQTEADYIQRINRYFGGEMEQVVMGGRIDILTDQYAIEVERASKWKNAIGQALWYAMQKDRKAGIILILEEPSEFKYLQMLQSTLDNADLSRTIQVWAYPYDFNDRSVPPPPKSPHWLTTSSNIRHNVNCRYYEKAEGRACSADEGVACQVCGG